MSYQSSGFFHDLRKESTSRLIISGLPGLIPLTLKTFSAVT